MSAETLEERQRLACIRAAKPCGLIKVGWGTKVRWYSAANWDHNRPDASLGGPWSPELVSEVAALGWLGIDLEGKRASLTRISRAVLKPPAPPVVRVIPQEPTR